MKIYLAAFFMFALSDLSMADARFAWSQTIGRAPAPTVLTGASILRIDSQSAVVFGRFQDGTGLAKFNLATGEHIWRTLIPQTAILGGSYLPDDQTFLILLGDTNRWSSAKRYELLRLSSTGEVVKKTILDINLYQESTNPFVFESTFGIVSGQHVHIVASRSSLGRCRTMLYQFDREGTLTRSEGLASCNVQAASFAPNGFVLASSQFAPNNEPRMIYYVRNGTGLAWSRRILDARYHFTADSRSDFWISSFDGTVTKVSEAGQQLFAVPFPSGEGSYGNLRLTPDESGGALIYEARSVTRFMRRIESNGNFRWSIPAPELPFNSIIKRSNAWLYCFGATCKEVDDSGVITGRTITFPQSVVGSIEAGRQFAILSTPATPPLPVLVVAFGESIDYTVQLGPGREPLALHWPTGSVPGVGVDVRRSPLRFDNDPERHTATLRFTEAAGLPSGVVTGSNGPNLYGSFSSVNLNDVNDIQNFQIPPTAGRVVSRFASNLAIMNQATLPISPNRFEDTNRRSRYFLGPSDELISIRNELALDSKFELIPQSWRIERTNPAGAITTLRKDLPFPGGDSSIPSNVVERGGNLFFVRGTEVWRVEANGTANVFAQLPAGFWTSSLGISPDGTVFAATGRNGAVRLMGGNAETFPISWQSNSRQHILVRNDGTVVFVSLPDDFLDRIRAFVLTYISPTGTVSEQRPFGTDGVSVTGDGFARISNNRALVHLIRYRNGIPETAFGAINISRGYTPLPSGSTPFELGRRVMITSDGANNAYLARTQDSSTLLARYRTDRVVPFLNGSSSVAGNTIQLTGEVIGDTPTGGISFEVGGSACNVNSTSGNCSVSAGFIGRSRPRMEYTGDMKNFDGVIELDAVEVSGSATLGIGFVPRHPRAQGAQSGLQYRIVVRNSSNQVIRGLKVAHTPPVGLAQFSCFASVGSRCSVGVGLVDDLQSLELDLTSGGSIVLAIDGNSPSIEAPASMSAALTLPPGVSNATGTSLSTGSYAQGVFADSFD